MKSYNLPFVDLVYSVKGALSALLKKKNNKSIQD